MGFPDFCPTEGGLKHTDLFGDYEQECNRLPRRPYCSDDLAYGLSIRDLQSAILKPYLQINPPHLRSWLLFDVDHNEAMYSWYDASLPFPTWVAINPENGHGHVAYSLSVPVLVDSPNMRQAPMKYLCAIESIYRERLGADRGFSGLITKNPTHGKWKVFRLTQVLHYDLDELADYIDPEVLKKHTPKGRLEEQIGLGRNVMLFETLRRWAYEAVREYRGSQRNYVLWSNEAYRKALERNGDFIYPLDERECFHIAKSVSKWTWKKDADALARFTAKQAARGRVGGKANTSEAQAIKGAIGGLGNTSEIQAAKGRLNTSESQAAKGAIGGVASGLARMALNEDKRGSARIMAAKGMTQRDIAEELGVSQKTISNWLKKFE